MERTELLRYAGNPDQLYSVRRFTYEDGDASGMSAVRVKSPSGLRLTLLEERGLDIYDCEYKGVNLSFLSKNGLRSGTRFHGEEGEFTYGFNGGMLFTAGLLNIGNDGPDGGVYYPCHGRYDSHGVRELSMRSCTDTQDITVSGVIGEAKLFGESLRMTRTVTVSGSEAVIRLRDELENLSPLPAEVALLYHINLGYPFLREGVRLVTGSDVVTPRNDDAMAGMAEYDVMSAPVDGCPEQVFFHDITPDRKGWAEITAENEELGLAFTVRYKKDNLPVLSQWKSMASGDYTLGLEPCTNHLAGRAGSREAGELKTVEGFGRLVFEAEIRVSELKPAAEA